MSVRPSLPRAARAAAAIAPSLDRGTDGDYVAVFALVLAYVATVAAYCALRTLAKLRRDTHLLSRGTRGPHGQQSLIEVTTALRRAERGRRRTGRATARARRRCAGRDPGAGRQRPQRGAVGGRRACRCRVRRAAPGRAGALRRVLRRCPDGCRSRWRCSTTTATAWRISAITGRSDTRVYAKPIADGQGEQELSPEERQAVSVALDDKGGCGAPGEIICEWPR